MDEQQFRQREERVYGRLMEVFDALDVEEADLENAGDVVTILFRGGSRCVINMQTPTRQIWLAAQNRGWHFDYDEQTQRWLDDRGSGQELFALVSSVTSSTIGIDLRF